MSDISEIVWGAIVLAAGKGTRMQSDLPKVLHEVAGRPMVARVLDAIALAGITQRLIVIGGDVNKFNDLIEQYPTITITLQQERKGTGDAVAAAGFGLNSFKLPSYAKGQLLRGDQLTADYLLICTGDTPCLAPSTLRTFIESGVKAGCKLGVIGMVHPNPTGYGRLVLDEDGRLSCIVEEKDASAEQKSIQLCNSGIVFCERRLLERVLGLLKNNNNSKEFYLTDCFEHAAGLGERAYVYQTPNYQEFDGVNTPEQLRKVTNWLSAEGRT